MTEAPGAEPTTGGRSPAMLYAFLAMVGAFATVSLVDALTTSWLPIHDFAALELRTRDLFTSDTPLLGSHGRYGWSSPGPTLVWALAPGYWLTGGSSAGLLASAVVVNSAALAGCLVLAWRRGGPLLLCWSAVLLAVLVRALGAGVFQSPWNPWVTVLPLVGFVLVCWSASMGERWAVPVALVVGTVLAQGHIAYLPLVAITGAWLVGVRLLAWHRDRSPAEERRASARSELRLWLLSIAGVSLLWLPTLVDQLARSGNVGAMVRFFTTDQPDTTGPARGMGLASTELGPFGPWLTGSTPKEFATGEVATSPEWQLLLPLVGLVAAFLVARRRGPDGSLQLLGLAAVLGPVSLVLMSRISGRVIDYLLAWSWAVAFVVWLAIGWPLLGAARDWAVDRLGSAVPPVFAGASMVLVATLLVATPDLGGAPAPQEPEGEVVRELLPGVEEVVAEVDGPVLVRPVDPPGVGFPLPTARSYASGIALQLERDGAGFRVLDDDWSADTGLGGVRLFGDHRGGTDGAGGTLIVVNGPAVDTFEAPAGSAEVGRVEHPDAARQDELEADLANRLRADGFGEAADAVATEALVWLPVITPGLEEYHDEIDRLLEIRDSLRASVWWVPGELVTGPLVPAEGAAG